jgi:hypothetical protein
MVWCRTTHLHTRWAAYSHIHTCTHAHTHIRSTYKHIHMCMHTYTHIHIHTHTRWAAYLGEKAEPQVVLRDYWESENEDDHQVIIDASLRHALLKRDEL